MLLLERSLAKPGDLLSDDGAHRPAHEGEVHHPEYDRNFLERAGDRDDRVRVADLVERLLQPGRILGKPERIGGPDVDLGLLRGAFIDEQRRVLARADATVK